MSFIGGDITEAVCVHPTLGTFRYEAKANEAFTLDQGGIRTDDTEDGVTGAGNPIFKMSMIRWSLDGPVAVDLLGDQEVSGSNALAASTIPGVWTLSSISGAVFKGTGKPVGDLKPDTNTAQMKLKVAGGGKLEQIA